VILRMRRAKINPARLEGYRRFEAERYMPILRNQPGFLGVLFLQQAENHAALLTLWEDEGTVEALQSSPSYRQTTHELSESVLLAGDQSVELLEVEGGDLRPEALVGALDRKRCSGSSLSPAARSPD
jgi:heme-degrading monooxygenase HmoA